MLKSMQKQLQKPDFAAEKGFERIITLSSDEDIKALLADWGILPTSTSFYDVETSADPNSARGYSSDSSPEGALLSTAPPLKFPRTSHALNLGAATRDDKVLLLSDLNRLVSSQVIVTVEEKVDGANMGLSLSPDGKLLVQNRSHYISSLYHPQFAPLDKWLARHSDELWTVLVPGRHVLYGEWLFATHSVKYTRLPDLFVAFDLYDRFTKRFASRDVMERRLRGTTIKIVPIIYRGPLKSVDHVRKLSDGPSAFNDDRREGIVLRTFEREGTAEGTTPPIATAANEDGGAEEPFPEWLALRAKSVRSDFIAGNERFGSA